MQNVYKLTAEQKDQLVNQTWDGFQYFNPRQDINGNWFISEGEVNGCNHPEISNWIHELPLIAYNPVVSELPF